MDKFIAAERWLPEDSKEAEAIDLRYKFAIDYCKDRVVLDAGCGFGYGSKLLMSEAQRVYGVDYSKDAVKSASKNYYHPGLYFSVMDVRNLGFKNKAFNATISVAVIAQIKEHNTFLSEIKRVLQKEGIFIITTPNKVFETQDLKGLSYLNPWHIRSVGFKELRKLLKSYFPFVQIYGIRNKRKVFYSFLRWLDFFNIRLVLPDIKRKEVKESLGEVRNLTTIEKVNLWNAHTFQCLIAVCKL
ncbi:class I SAM-dependent methyltransferase [candidate division WOR-3 bacterium]|nr:class I SAM-dependent methyltransferase [candidate division WOR-3 bacterium]